MGSVLSSGDAPFKLFYDNLTKSSLPLYLCFLLHRNEQDVTKIPDILRLIEAKYINPNNKYAFVKLKSNSQSLATIDFCDYQEFLAKLNELTVNELANNNLETAPIEASSPNLPDLYQHAYLNLEWKSGIKVVIDINGRPLKPQRKQLVDNYGVEIFDFTSNLELDLLTTRLDKIESKRVEEKYVPLYKFSRPYSQRKEVHFERATKMSFKREVLSQEFVSTFDSSSLRTKDVFESEPAKFYLEDIPFAQGKEVYCFKGYIFNPETKNYYKRVFKLAKYREIDLSVNFLAQTIAGYLAKEFTNAIGGKINVQYSEACLVRVEDGDGQIYLVEEFLEGDFCKFTSNEYLLEGEAAQYSEDEKKLIEFSHWSHEWTGNNLMVVDLQGFKDGIEFKLTDPAIHSYKNQFGVTDLGSNGFGRYYVFHKCCLNELIINLSIINPVKQPNKQIQNGPNTLPPPNRLTTTPISPIPHLYDENNHDWDNQNNRPQNSDNYSTHSSSDPNPKTDDDNPEPNEDAENNQQDQDDAADNSQTKKETNFTKRQTSKSNVSKQRPTSKRQSKIGLSTACFDYTLNIQRKIIRLKEPKQVPERMSKASGGSFKQKNKSQNGGVKRRSKVQSMSYMLDYARLSMADKEKEQKRMVEFKSLLDLIIDYYAITMRNVNELARYDPFVRNSRDKCKELRRSMRVERLGYDALVVYKGLMENYARLFDLHRNKVVRYIAIRGRHSGEVREFGINDDLSRIIGVTIRLFEMFEDYLGEYRSRIIESINWCQLALDLRGFREEDGGDERFVNKLVPLYRQFIENHGISSQQIEVFKENLKKNFNVAAIRMDSEQIV